MQIVVPELVPYYSIKIDLNHETYLGFTHCLVVGGGSYLFGGLI
jgi:hypothetical protein